ncbi:hypothetical protein ASC80_14815 [Afipia sp. Root123D2]|uniref:BA14K family protein n=1 Tax=Afipia sp. Root123D2 TaxID=1736436 RepID=UPI0006F5A070|nr:BA14K family protein [Afipia sp. Root123D2]KQW21356.1 hypothetical protein ASC80_14815 [Afipia sp. Root123D2]
MNNTWKLLCAAGALAFVMPLSTAPAAAQKSVPTIGGGGGGGPKQFTGGGMSRGGGAPVGRAGGGGFAGRGGMRPVPTIPSGGGRWAGGGGRGWHGGHHHRRGGGWWGPGVGFGAGYALGSAYGSYPYNNYYYDDDSYGYSPGYVESDGVSAADVAYCQQRFKSYNVRTGTYLGYDGLRHACP